MRAPDPATRTVLVVANETIGGENLLDAIRERAAEDVRFVLCAPQNKPRAGLVIYDDAVFDAAQVRVDLALEVVRDMGIRAIGESPILIPTSRRSMRSASTTPRRSSSRRTRRRGRAGCGAT